MTPTWQFWMTWAVQATGAIGTIAAVTVALFGEPLRRKLIPPKLEFRIAAKVWKTDYWLPSAEGSQWKSEAWWYHLQVINPRRWPGVTQVRVNLIEIEVMDSSGVPAKVWSGEAALQWANPGDHPLLRDIGHPADADLCSVVRTDHLRLYPRESLGGFQTEWGKPTNLFLTFQAKGIEADTNPFRVQIAWDGQWSDDEKTMARHLVVKEAPQVSSLPRQR